MEIVVGHTHDEGQLSGSGADSSSNSTNVALFKIMSVVVLFTLALGSGICPLVMPKVQTLQRVVIPMANVGAAGVFLTMGLAHLLPEAAESMGDAFGEDVNDQYRIAFMVAILGYVLVLALQRVVPLPGGGDGLNAHHQRNISERRRMRRRSAATGCRDAHDNDYNPPPPTSQSFSSRNRTGTGVSALLMESSFHQNREQSLLLAAGDAPTTVKGGPPPPAPALSSTSSSYGTTTATTPTTTTNYATATRDDHQKQSHTKPPFSCRGGEGSSSSAAAAALGVVRDGDSSCGDSLDGRQHVSASQGALLRPTDWNTENTVEQDGVMEVEEIDDDDEAAFGSRIGGTRASSRMFVAAAALGQDPNNNEDSKKVRSYALMIALIAHSFSAGAALGVQSSKRQVINIFVALLAHKWAEGLTLGLSILNAPSGSLGTKTNKLVIILIFSAGTPIGIFLGWIAEAALPASATGFLMALSAGTFLYIGASEVVAEEFQTRKHGGWKLLCFMLGCLLIFITTAYADSD